MAAFFLHVAASGAAVTVVFSESSLLAPCGSSTSLSTEAVLVISPAFFARTSIVTVADAPLSSVPSSQRTFLPWISQLPTDGSAEIGST